MAESDPLGRNWKLWGGILAFIAAVVVLGLIFVPRAAPVPEAAPPTTPAPTAPVESAQPTASPSRPRAGDCPALSTDTDFPNDAPATEWKRHPAGMLLPVSPEHGPAKQDGDFWRCFSHTPSGAVMAGITLMFDFSTGGVKDAAADSPARDDLFKEQQNATTNLEYPAITAYRVMNSSDAQASIEYLTKYGDQYAAMRTDLVWSPADNDWRLDLSVTEPDWNLVNDPSSYTDFK
ncbi:hypothetical protein ACSYDW_18745 [Paeniglutamicibacter sp. R2-26]|uniref:hypothetical protein n=1 Tax=Paeniglutamicibacter sp. R2-26 TaxID=3144417 RepID=UPI003EE59E7F